MANSQEGISLKLFLGTRMTPDLKETLEKNPIWRQEKVVKETFLTEIIYQKKPYIGVYLSDGQNKLPVLQEMESDIKKILQKFCPDKNCAALKMVVFPQIFVR